MSPRIQAITSHPILILTLLANLSEGKLPKEALLSK